MSRRRDSMALKPAMDRSVSFRRRASTALRFGQTEPDSGVCVCVLCCVCVYLCCVCVYLCFVLRVCMFVFCVYVCVLCVWCMFVFCVVWCVFVFCVCIFVRGPSVSVEWYLCIVCVHVSVNGICVSSVCQFYVIVCVHVCVNGICVCVCQFYVIVMFLWEKCSHSIFT